MHALAPKVPTAGPVQTRIRPRFRFVAAVLLFPFVAAVSISQLQPGDLVFFTGASHVGIYIGGGQFIHAPHTGDVVKISSLSGYYSSNFAGGRRI